MLSRGLQWVCHSRHLTYRTISNVFSINNDELLPGISKSEFANRRSKLFNSMPSNSCVILSAAPEVWMSHDIPHEYRQESSFLYLTGLEEPDSIAVLKKHSDKITSYSLFLRDRDPASELWDGPRAGIKGAIDVYQADQAFSIHHLQEHISKLLMDTSEIFVKAPMRGNYDPRFVQATKPYHKFFLSADLLIDQLRVIKSPIELVKMRSAADIGSNAFLKVMRNSIVGASELQLAGEFEHSCKSEGAIRTAFPCVVASGNNATIIHYLTKRSALSDGDLLLMDSGCEVAGGYVSDITRTWPVNGRFSSPQRILYNLVLDTQIQCLQYLQNAISNRRRVTLDEVHYFSVKILTAGMRELGILSSDSSNMEFQKFNPTHVGHYLGMDVHDTSSISRSYPLTSGMVITIEPGIYLSKSNENVPKEFRGIGVRIEDDVVITEGGIEILTQSIPKAADAVEVLIGQN